MLNKISTILADIDPRREKQPALGRAHGLAKRTGAKVHLFTCDYVQALSGGVFFDNKNLKKAREEYVAELEEWLDEQAKELRDDGLDVSTKVHWHKPRHETLLEYAKEVEADVIIRAAREHSKVDRLILGATDWELIRSAPQIVWLAKKNQQSPTLTKVLAAVDPTHPADEKADLDKRLLETADDFRQIFSGNMHVFHAYMPPTTATPIDAGATMTAAAVPMPRVDAETVEMLRDSLYKAIKDLTGAYQLPDENIHLVAGDTAASIQEVVSEQDIDVVVAGAVSRGWLERLVIGSTAEKLLDVVDCDLIVVKPEDFKAA